jgi:hypothetical protein
MSGADPRWEPGDETVDIGNRDATGATDLPGPELTRPDQVVDRGLAHAQNRGGLGDREELGGHRGRARGCSGERSQICDGRSESLQLIDRSRHAGLDPGDEVPRR